MNRGCLFVLASAALICCRSTAVPAETAFTYQGHLTESGAPANGAYDLRFELFSEQTAGVPWSLALTNEDVAVSNGVFTTLLDFDTNVFSGSKCWLEIGVRRAGLAAPFAILSPRQLLTPVPYAIYTLRAESLAGPLPDSQLSSNVARLDANQTFSGQIGFAGPVVIGASNAPANLDIHGAVQAAAFSGSGAGLSNVSASALSVSLVQRMWRVSIPFVAITNAGNPPDTTEKGAVFYNFRIGKFEINNYQYAAFLNAIAADDPHMTYRTNMTADVYGGIIRTGMPGDYRYTPKPGMEHLPVVWVQFHAALRFCNWLHNGQPVGAQDETTTEAGAYTLTPEGEAANTIMRNANARFWLPSDDEWYKAAYYQPAASGGPPGDYWWFPTRSNEVPLSELPPGGSNSANSCCATDRTATPVGAYLNTRSYYGAYDLAGNVQEWTEEIVLITNRRLRGGSWNYNELYSHSSDFEFDTPDYDAEGIGFRVAGALEP